jgi:hypothetical protein
MRPHPLASADGVGCLPVGEGAALTAGMAAGQTVQRRGSGGSAVVEAAVPGADSHATIAALAPWAPAPDPAASALAAQVREQMARAAVNVRRYPRPFTGLPRLDEVNAPDDGARSPGRPPAKLDTDEALAAIERGWAAGLSVRETARRATRAPSYVHGVFVRLDGERGPRPVNTQGQSGRDSTS